MSNIPILTIDQGLDQAVNRRPQIDRFKDTLARVHNRRPAPTTLFEWHGGPGIGKTMLVQLLQRECAKQGFPNALIDFGRGGNAESYISDPTLLIENIAPKIFSNVDIQLLLSEIAQYRASDLPSAIIPTYFNLVQSEDPYHEVKWVASLHLIVNKFIELLYSLDKHDPISVTPVVFFFDETEKADFELIDWIEEWIIGPLSQLKHCIIVWTARRPWRWKRPEIRRRMYSEALEVFAPDEVRLQLKSSSSNPDLTEAFFRRVYSVTGGHPFANRVVISQLDTWPHLTPEIFSDREADLYGAIFEQFVRGYAFQSLKTNDLKTACELLSMVRLFDTTMLREILKKCAGEEYNNWKQEDFGDLLNRLKRTQLLVWSKGYAIDPSLRFIIREYFFARERATRLENKPDTTYLNVNVTALLVYDNWLKRPVDNRNMFVIEELYQQACLSRIDETYDLVETLNRRLQEYPIFIADSEVLRNVLERLAEELERDFDLNQLVSGTLIATMVEAVHRFLSSLNLSETLQP